MFGVEVLDFRFQTDLRSDDPPRGPVLRRFPRALWNIEDTQHDSGIDVSQEPVLVW